MPCQKKKNKKKKNTDRIPQAELAEYAKSSEI